MLRQFTGLVIAGTAVLTLGACDNGETTSSPGPGPVTTATAPAGPSPVQAAPPMTVFGPGSYIVGRDITEGTYHTEGPAGPGVGCYWQRDGDTGTPVANHLSRAPETVVILNSDTAFHTEGCKPWAKAG